jgi:hypothetical protein
VWRAKVYEVTTEAPECEGHAGRFPPGKSIVSSGVLRAVGTAPDTSSASGLPAVTALAFLADGLFRRRADQGCGHLRTLVWTSR